MTIHHRLTGIPTYMPSGLRERETAPSLYLGETQHSYTFVYIMYTC